MHLVSVTDLGAEVDGRWLFSGASFGLRTGDRVGVVGPNGVGKTTLLRILAGAREPDAGEVVFRRDTRVAWLPQESVWVDGSAVDVVCAAAPTLIAVHDAQALLSRLGVDPDHPTDQMSGGQRRRVALARTLAQPADVLILDEPTNHLDVATVDWLEGELTRRQVALVMVTHDRYLLERAVNRMLDLAPGGRQSNTGASVMWHDGTYSSLLEARQQRADQADRASARARGLLTKEVAWLRRQPKARTSKPQFRVDQVAALREAARSDPDVAPLELGTGRRRLGRQVMELEGVTVRRGEVTVLDGVDVAVGPGERVGIVGPNGAGKTTLLEVMTGHRQPDAGTARIGNTVQLGFYAQQADIPSDATTVIDTLTTVAAHIPLANGETLPASRLAERFGFPTHLQRTAVADLSGGERRRLALLHVLIDAPNVLVLDEPTNDLDLDTLAVLEDHLDGFAGTLIVATHDRFVLDRLTDRILAVGGGAISEHLDHAQAREHGAPAAATGSSASRSTLDATEANRARQQARRERRRAEQQVEDLTDRRNGVLQEMATQAHDHARLIDLQRGLTSVTDQLSQAEAAWLEAAEAEEDAGAAQQAISDQRPGGDD